MMFNSLINKSNFFTTAIELSDLAASISKKYFRKSINIEYKKDSSPVTIADQEIELNLRNWISNRYPDHNIIGEEFSDSNAYSDYTWIIDPIDGTIAFATGKPTFTTLIALYKGSTPIISIINQPIVNERYISLSGYGTWLNENKITTNNQTNLADARLNATTPYMFKTDSEQLRFKELQKKVAFTSWGGDAYAYGLLACGYIDLVMESDLKFYDVAPLLLIVQESGGIITDWDGQYLSLDNFSGQVLASSNQTLHKIALKAIHHLH